MCQRKQCSSQASGNRFSMTSTSLSIDSVYEEKEFSVKPGKDTLGQYGKNDMAKLSKEDYKEEVVELKKRIRELEKALEFSKLETLARDMMIDKAEEYFDIPIRKKPGAK